MINHSNALPENLYTRFDNNSCAPNTSQDTPIIISPDFETKIFENFEYLYPLKDSRPEIH